MRDALAERLLATVMKWTPQDVARERPDLQALATYRYDQYQQFFPGMKFIESLALWLSQFTTDKERRAAYDFVRKRLVFISDEQMKHLVAMAYPDFIRGFLIRQAAGILNCSEWQIAKIHASKEFRVLLRQSLFLGMSDGAHTDVFRRSNPDISNEQIRQTHEISRGRAKDMLGKLAEELTRILGHAPGNGEGLFRNVFLLDDFSASGISYIRKETSGSGHTGKVSKFFQAVSSEGAEMSNLVNREDLNVALVLYVSTEHARAELQRNGQELFGQIPFTVFNVFTLTDSLRIEEASDADFYPLLEKYYDGSIQNKHYEKGRMSRPFLGFDECALPVVLEHNTPNNSLPLLWFSEGRKVRGLFPRYDRFRDIT